MTVSPLVTGVVGAAALVGVAGWVLSARRLRVRSVELARAEHDGLTGLLRREGFERRAPAALARGNAAALLDVDGFKRINDTHGHAVGDEVLRVIAARLVAELGETALVGRVGGDEFALIGALDFPAVHGQMDSLVDVLTAPIPMPGAGELTVGVSLGVVWLCDLPTWDTAALSGRGRNLWSVLLAEALGHADIAMYEAKALRHGWRLYNRDIDPIRPAVRIDPVPSRRFREHGPAALAGPLDGFDTGSAGQRRGGRV